MSTIGWGFLALFVLYYINYFRCLFKNIAIAKQSGLPYVITPVHGLNRAWLVQSRLWLPHLQKLPPSIKGLWVDMLDNEWPYKLKRKPFDQLKSNAFIDVSPGKNTLYVGDAEAIVQIATRRNDFPKAVELYTSLDIYGKNVVSTEGSVWRHHRKITSPPFTEKNNHLVWQESLHQARSMIASWVKEGQRETGPIADLPTAAMRLSLHVISRAGFGVKLLWPHEEAKRSKAGELPEGHTMSFKDALSTLLETIIGAFLFPRWFLKHAPLSFTRRCYSSLTNWRLYMQEMYDAKRAELASGKSIDAEGLDLMGALVKGAGITSTSSADADKGSSSGQLLSDSEILGNAFVFVLAGHETAANSIHFSTLQLAMHPASQRRLQRDLDDILGKRPVEEWSYDEDIPKLFGSMAGAVLNEELRLWPPVIGVPKCTKTAQPLTIDGKRVTVPGNMLVTLATLAAHTDPRYWPTKTPDDPYKDLWEFRPERWLIDPSSPSSTAAANKPVTSHASSAAEDTERGVDPGGPTSEDTSAALFKPARGAYLPFSEGYRSCLGRRFAQVEVLAVMATLFREYSVELAVEEILGPQFPFNSDGYDGTHEQHDHDHDHEHDHDGTETATTATTRRGPVRDLRKEGTGREEWDRARERADGLFRTAMGTVITLQMRQGRVPVRIVRRGEERFDYDV